MGAMSLVPQPDADDEVERLRLLIERQPTCLLRVGLDGVILAANDAALGQLGARQLGQALGRRFTQWMAPNHRDRWFDLARRAYENGAASIECELLDLAERRHAVQIRAVKQPPHPDGKESMTLASREISGMSRLEQALLDQEAAGLALANARERLEAHGKARAAGSEERARLQRELDEARAEIERLAARLAEHGTARDDGAGRVKSSSTRPGRPRGYVMTTSVLTDQWVDGGARQSVGPPAGETPAPRLPASLVPAITGVRISPGGALARLVNISRSGALVECDSRLAPGAEVMVHFAGTFQPTQVPSRVARVNVSGIGPNGALTYQIGLAFATPVTLPDPPALRPEKAPAVGPAPPAIRSQPGPVLRNRW